MLTDAGKEWISKTFALRKAVRTEDEVEALIAWLNDAYTNVAMANYPYPASFLGDLPAFPVRVGILLKAPGWAVLGGLGRSGGGREECGPLKLASEATGLAGRGAHSFCIECVCQPGPPPPPAPMPPVAEKASCAKVQQ